MDESGSEFSSEQLLRGKCRHLEEKCSYLEEKCRRLEEREKIYTYGIQYDLINLHKDLNNKNQIIIALQEELYFTKEKLEKEYESKKFNQIEKKMKEIGDQFQKFHVKIERSLTLLEDREHLRECDGNFDEIDEVFAGEDCESYKKESEINSRRKLLHSTLYQKEQDDNHVCSVLTEKHWLFVSERIGQDWKKIVRQLNMKEYNIEKVEEDYKHSSIVEKAYQGFTKWMRDVPQTPGFCILAEILENISRRDVMLELHDNFPECSSKESFGQMELYMASAENFFGRADEVEKIKKFCDESQESKRLLFINGLPGIGKKETLMEALSSVDRNRIIQPNFFIRDKNEKKWTFDEILKIIANNWKSQINPDVRGHVNIKVTLSNVQKPFILILEIAPLRLEKSEKFMTWNFIRTLMRIRSKLKIIFTSCEIPQQIILSNVPLEIVSLRGLTYDQSKSLLQNFCPTLSDDRCEIIFKCCGGNPLLLREISNKINKIASFSNFNDEIGSLITYDIHHKSLKLDWIKRLVKHTYWSQKMTNVLEMMEANELVVLAKLNVFITNIPKTSLPVIYKDSITLAEADSLYENHCILESDDQGKNYRISTIYRAFIDIYISNDNKLYLSDDREQKLRSIQKDSLTSTRRFILKLLINLGKIFHSRNFIKTSDECEKLISEYQIHNNLNFITSLAIWKFYDLQIIQFIKEPSYPVFLQSLLTQPFEIIQFLRCVIPNEHLMKFRKYQFVISDNDNEIDCALALATYILLKVQKTGEDLLQDVKVLGNCIKVMEKGSNLPLPQRKVLLLCYLNRSQGFTLQNNKVDAYKDLTKAKEICASQDIGEVGKIAYYDAYAETSYHFEKYKITMEYRQLQLELSVEVLGDHPLTAKAYYLLGKSQQKIPSSTQLVLYNYNKAKEMYAVLIKAMEAEHIYFMKDLLATESELLTAISALET